MIPTQDFSGINFLYFFQIKINTFMKENFKKFVVKENLEKINI